MSIRGKGPKSAHGEADGFGTIESSTYIDEDIAVASASSTDGEGSISVMVDILDGNPQSIVIGNPTSYEPQT